MAVSEPADRVENNDLYVDMSPSDFTKPQEFGNYSVPPPPIPYIPSSPKTLPVSSRRYKQFLPATGFRTEYVNARRKLDFSSSLQSLRETTAAAATPATPSSRHRFSWMGQYGETRGPRDFEKRMNNQMNEGIAPRRECYARHRFDSIYEDSDVYYSDAAASYHSLFNSRYGNPLPHDAEELYRKLNMLVIHVESQNKKIEEIRRACQSLNSGSRTEATQTTGAPSPIGDGDVKNKSSLVSPLLKRSSRYVVNRDSETSVDDGRGNTYKSYEDIDDVSQTPVKHTHMTPLPPPKMRPSFARRLISCVKPIK